MNYHLDVEGIIIPYADTELTGRDIACPHITQSGKVPYINKSLIKIWKQCFQPGDTVLDVGAYIGVMSIHFAILGGIVHAFEGSPRNYTRLKKICKPLRQITIHPVALHQVNQKCNTQFNDCIGRLHPVQEIQYVIYDEYAANRHLTPSFVKMDIEGMETIALYGMTKLIDEVRPIWQIEYHPNLPFKYEQYPGFVTPKDGGFDLQHEFSKRDYLIKSEEWKPIKNLDTTRRNNYFFVPNEKRRLFHNLGPINHL
jgi:FkbM family methyltransferase